MTKLPSSTSYVFVHNSFFSFPKLFLAVAQITPQEENSRHSFSLKLRQLYDRDTHTVTYALLPKVRDTHKSYYFLRTFIDSCFTQPFHLTLTIQTNPLTLKPILTPNIKPSVNPQTGFLSCENHPKCPHLPKRSSFCQKEYFDIQYLATTIHTHTHKKFYDLIRSNMEYCADCAGTTPVLWECL